MTPAELLPNITSWTYHATHLMCRAQDPHTRAIGTYTLTHQDLTNIHPQLPSALSSMIEFTVRTSKKIDLPRQHLACLVAHLLYPTFVVDEQGETHWVQAASDFAWDGTSPTVFLSGLCYEVLDHLPVTATAPEQPVAPYVAWCSHRFVDVSVSWLDTQYPGWSTRYAAGSTLGYGEPELFQYACSGDFARPAADLTPVTFE